MICGKKYLGATRGARTGSSLPVERGPVWPGPRRQTFVPAYCTAQAGRASCPAGRASGPADRASGPNVSRRASRRCPCAAIATSESTAAANAEARSAVCSYNVSICWRFSLACPARLVPSAPATSFRRPVSAGPSPPARLHRPVSAGPPPRAGGARCLCSAACRAAVAASAGPWHSAGPSALWGG